MQQKALTYLKVKASIVVDAPLEEVWKTCRAWGRQPWMPLLPDGTTFDVKVLDDYKESEVGAVRCSKFGGGSQIFEQLVSLDDEKHSMSWQCVSHENTVSPFQEASFLNFMTTLTLAGVTMGNKTFAEWKGSCYTEPAFADLMQDTLETWYQGGMASLKGYIAHQQQKQLRIAHSAQLRHRCESESTLQRIQEESGTTTTSSSSSLAESHLPTYSTTTQRLAGFRM